MDTIDNILYDFFGSDTTLKPAIKARLEEMIQNDEITINTFFSRPESIIRDIILQIKTENNTNSETDSDDSRLINGVVYDTDGKRLVKSLDDAVSNVSTAGIDKAIKELNLKIEDIKKRLDDKVDKDELGTLEEFNDKLVELNK